MHSQLCLEIIYSRAPLVCDSHNSAALRCCSEGTGLLLARMVLNCERPLLFLSGRLSANDLLLVKVMLSFLFLSISVQALLETKAGIRCVVCGTRLRTMLDKCHRTLQPHHNHQLSPCPYVLVVFSFSLAIVG